MRNDMIHKLAKYVVQALIVYMLLKYIPKQQIGNRELIIFTSVIVLSLAVFDSASNIFGLNKNSGSCSVKEPMTVVNAPSTVSAPAPTAVIVPAQTTTVARTPEVDHTVVEAVNTLMKAISNGTKSNSESEGSSVNSDSNANSNKVNDNGFLSYMIKPYDDFKNNRSGTRYENDVITNEMEYTDFNTLPIPKNLNSEDFEYGDSFLPPDKWYPTPPHPPVCVAEKKCPVCPITTIGTPVDVKEWDQSRRITPADNINVKYIKEKLNSGR